LACGKFRSAGCYQYLGFLPRQGNFTTSSFQSWTYHRIAILSFSYKEISFCLIIMHSVLIIQIIDGIACLVPSRGRLVEKLPEDPEPDPAAGR
jgi:hypothetical protein